MTTKIDREQLKALLTKVFEADLRCNITTRQLRVPSAAASDIADSVFNFVKHDDKTPNPTPPKTGATCLDKSVPTKAPEQVGTSREMVDKYCAVCPVDPDATVERAWNEMMYHIADQLDELKGRV